MYGCTCFKVYKESKRLKCRIRKCACWNMVLKRFNGTEREVVKSCRQVVDSRQIRLAPRLVPKKESTKLVFSSFLRVSLCFTMNSACFATGCTTEKVHTDMKKRKRRKNEQATYNEKTIVTPSSRQGLVTRKQRDTPFHKDRPSSINNVEGS